MAPKKVILIGVCGGSCSGKTYFSQMLHEKLGNDKSDIVFQDWYYRDQSKRFDKDGGAVNFDHPSSIDFEFMRQQLLELKNYKAINAPIYDFVTHTRLGATQTVQPKEILIVDGILIFSQPIIFELFDFSIFFDTPEQIRLQRRLQRDMLERGRSREGVIAQFEKHVKPMHELFVEPSKSLANRIITDEDKIDEAAESLIDWIKDADEK